MKKALVLALSLTLFSCAEQTHQQVKKLNYNLFDKIYNQADMHKINSLTQVENPNIQTLNTPTYVKVFHGSYKDKEGNVINGGFMWLKLNNGSPHTNF